MPSASTLAKAVATALAAVLYVWVAAVRSVPAVRARKAARRGRRRT